MAERNADKDPDKASKDRGKGDGPPKRGVFESQWTYLLIIPIVVVIWLVIQRSKETQERFEDIEPAADTISASPLVDSDMDEFGQAIAKVWAGEAVDRATLPERLLEPGQAVYVAFRSDGKRLYHLWRFPKDVTQGGTMWDVLVQAIEDGRKGVGDDLSKVDRLEIALSHSYRVLDYNDKQQRKLLLDQDPHKIPHHMGVRGLQVEHEDKLKIISPTWFVAQNRQVSKQLKLIRNEWKLDDEQFAQSTFSTFEADQVLVRLDAEPVEAVLMFRGNRNVDIAEVTQASTAALAQGMANWLINNTGPDGRLVYYYFPSGEKESTGNNMIRQWMATNAMVRWAEDKQDQAVFDLVEKNIDYNLEHFFHFEKDRKLIQIADGQPVPDDVLGVIEYRGKTKLGGVALAGMALWLHPKRDKWAQEIQGLRNMVDFLWHDDGSFVSFYKGADVEYWNFYPGEAMLWWATIYAETKDPALLEKYKKSFYFYRQWHLDPDNRNPAFVPWHLQADYTMWKALGEDEAEFKADLAEFCFEIADWLVENMQQWDEGEWLYADERGRFYAPDKKFGVPHASSTGVYLEGLIDAWQLARDLGDDDKRNYYRIAMLRGVRSMMQLQFVDDVDMYYISKPRFVEGGIRTTVYDNRIRCDNVQHPLMGIIKIVRMFEESEYRGAE